MLHSEEIMQIFFYPYDFVYKVKSGKTYLYLYGKTKSGDKICVVEEYEPYFYAKISASDIKEVEKKLARAKTLEKITEEISQRKKELYFGFSAWILNKIRVNQANTPVLRPFFDSLASKIGNDLEDITKIFISLFDTLIFLSFAKAPLPFSAFSNKFNAGKYNTPKID